MTTAPQLDVEKCCQILAGFVVREGYHSTVIEPRVIGQLRAALSLLAEAREALANLPLRWVMHDGPTREDRNLARDAIALLDRIPDLSGLKL